MNPPVGAQGFDHNVNILFRDSKEIRQVQSKRRTKIRGRGVTVQFLKSRPKECMNQEFVPEHPVDRLCDEATIRRAEVSPRTEKPLDDLIGRESVTLH
jgi:hypothetical protein